MFFFFLIADILQIQSRDTLPHTYFTCPSHLLIDLVAPSTEVTSAAAVAGCAWLLLLTCEQLSKPGNRGYLDTSMEYGRKENLENGGYFMICLGLPNLSFHLLLVGS